MNKNIAIIGTFIFHSFMSGFLLEIFRNHNVVLYHTYPDSYGDIDYFKKIFNFTLNTDVNSLVNIQYTYDYIFVLSANDPCIYYINTTNCYGIVHGLSIGDKPYKSILTLSKKISFLNKKLTYILPLYKGIISYNCMEREHITFIGYFNDNYIDDDTLNFINNIKYKFIIIGNQKPINFKHHNVIYYQNLSTEDSVNILNKTKFVITRKAKYMSLPYSGAIAVSFSNNVPLITSTDIQEEHCIPSCITFVENYSECTDILNNMTDEEYESLYIGTTQFLNETILKNKSLFTTEFL